MSNVQNLKKWHKGQSGNPSGRPKGSRNVSSLVRDMLEDETIYRNLTKGNNPLVDQSGGSRNAIEAITMALIAKGIKGDIRAAEWLKSTAYGQSVSQELDYPVALVEFISPRT